MEEGTGARHRGRPRWLRVRVETDEGAYVGRVRLEGHGSLRELVSDDRAYLALWGVTEQRSGRRDDFVALHKGAIRYVVTLSKDEDALARAAEV